MQPRASRAARQRGHYLLKSQAGDVLHREESDNAVLEGLRSLSFAGHLATAAVKARHEQRESSKTLPGAFPVANEFLRSFRIYLGTVDGANG